jgi:hypothetical protein
MKVVRSWPLNPPKTQKPHIIDDCERVYIKTVDYRPLADLNDDVIHLDWDVAVGMVELRNFAKKCLAEPNTVRVAPTMMYSSRYWRDELPGDGRGWFTDWMVQVQMNVGTRPIKYGEPYGHFFSFGLVYLPKQILRDFVNQLKDNEQFRDREFCQWFQKSTGGTSVPVEWATNAVHLNFSMKTALEGLKDGYN